MRYVEHEDEEFGSSDGHSEGRWRHCMTRGGGICVVLDTVYDSHSVCLVLCVSKRAQGDQTM